ncbi:MAG: UvrD-helicase domain-containing protein [Chitinophagaceae bacterium]|nr:UvrD-helicase domain-containing protein [Chitinophagaceae bacterium]
MSALVLDIYKASAGSGKTHLLTLQCLRLFLTTPQAYRHLLAVTFTNKATAEMKERVLHELASLAAGRQTQIAGQLLEAGVAADLATLQQHAASLYARILHDYSRFSVSTIDAFTQKMIRSCSWELGIDAAFAVQLNTQLVCQNLADLLFEKIDAPGYKALRRQLVSLAIERIDNGKSWNFRDDLLQMAGLLFTENYLNFEWLARQSSPEPADEIPALQAAVFATKKAAAAEWEQLVQHGTATLKGYGLTPDDFSQKMRGFGGVFERAGKNDIINNPLDNAYVSAVINDGVMPYSKATPAAIKSAIEQAMPALVKAVQALIDFCTHRLPALNTANALSSNLDYLRLVMLMGKELANWRKTNNALVITDTHNLLRQLSAVTTADFIYEKTGNRLQHFLMDEFQDTSDFQYHNFKPLLENAMAGGHYNLVVGDVKQAIYRWRNGDWALLQQKLPKDFGRFAPAQQSLHYNYRSARPIIEFNNYFFSLLPQLLQQHLNSLFTEAPIGIQKQLANSFGTVITDAYADAVQQVPPNAATNGRVEVRFVPKGDAALDEDDGYDVRVLSAVHQTIADLLAKGFSPGDIAILCRTNLQAQQTIEQLMLLQEAGGQMYPLLSAEALRISSNRAVQQLIAAMQWLLNDADALAEAMVLMANLPGGMPNWAEVFLPPQGRQAMLPTGLQQQRHRLKSLPVTDLINELIGLLNLQANTADLPYLLALQDMVQEWMRYADAGLDAFLQYWEDEGNTKALPAAPGSNAVEVVTIHRSKGLDFRVVLLPFCNWSLPPDAKKNITLWPDMSATDFRQLPVLPVRYSSNLKNSHLAYSYFEEMVSSYLDNLNLLYVALTRVRQYMVLWAPLPFSKTGKPTWEKLSHVQDVLYAAAVNDMPGHNGPAIRQHFNENDATWHYGPMPGPLGRPAAAAHVLPLLHYVPWRLQPGLLVQAARAEVPQGQAQGILLHEVLAAVSHPGQLDKALLQMQAAGRVSAGQVAGYRQMLTHILQLEPLCRWQNGGFKRLAERVLVLANGELKRPDLVLYNEAETIVVDFKFTEDKTEGHAAQVRGYMKWLTELGFTRVTAFLIYGKGPEVVGVK